MIREALRPLTRASKSWRGEPEVKLGRRPTSEGHYRAKWEGWHGQSAVTLDLNAEHGARTFEDPADLDALAAELTAAAAWLRDRQAEVVE